MATMHLARLRWASATALVASLLTFLTAAPASAGSSHADFTFAALPPALSLSDGVTPSNGLLEGVLTTQNTTTTHVVMTVTVQASEGIAFQGTGAADSCTTGTTGPVNGIFTTTFACSAPKLGPRASEIIPIEFRSPSSLQQCPAFTSSCLTFSATLTFAEGNGDTQGSDLLQANSSLLLFTSAQAAAAQGGCVTTQTTLGTQANQTNNQATQISFGQAKDVLPCTPGGVGVDPHTGPTQFHSTISFVAVPKLNQPAQVSITVFNLPSGTNAQKFALKELKGYTFGDPTSIPTSVPVTIDACQNGAIPSNDDACLLSQSKFGQGGVIVNLLVNPVSDPGFGY